jgi:hypothetical protein
MAISIDSLEILQTYLVGVISRAEHHAGNVEGVALALAGAVIWKSNGEIAVREYAGSPANIIWFWINDHKYSLVYNHSNGKIELRDRTQSGDTLAEFDNNTTYSEIIRIFNGL